MAPMNPRLLRPLASGVHPEAAAWRTAVVANGGSVSAATMRAVSKFCGDIDAAGLRDRFIRLNLFCGSDVLACLVPLYRGQSRTGTQFGNTTDTNSGSDLFVSGDYTETGATGGLAGNAALTKHLMTGVPHNTMPQNNAHLACYETVRAGGTFRISIGGRAGGNTNQFILATWASTSDYTFLAFSGGGGLDLANSGGGFYVGNITGATASALYRNGGSKVTSAGSTRNPGSETISVFGLNTAGLVGSRTNARLAGYSMGLAFASDADVLKYSDIMQDFQLALNRRIT
jgi:hypothetical protein